MKTKSIAVLLSLLLVLPMVFADSNDLLRTDIAIGGSASYDSGERTETIEVIKIDEYKDACLIRISNSEAFWVSDKYPIYIDNLELSVDLEERYSTCEVRVKTIDDNGDSIDDDYYVHDGNSIIAKIYEGESVNFNFDKGTSYEVEVLIIEDREDTEIPRVTLMVNGKILKPLGAGDNYELEDEASLIVGYIDTSSERDSVKVTIKTSGTYLDMDNDNDKFVWPMEPIDEDTDPRIACEKRFLSCLDKGNTDDDCSKILTQCRIDNIRSGVGVDTIIAVPIDEKYMSTDEFIPASGCRISDRNIVPVSTRMSFDGKESQYCDVDGKMKTQKADGEAAENNYECKSNNSEYGTCANLKEQAYILQKIFSWLSRIFGG
ncbi:MAG: hypothetical protein Q8Q42_01195 [Nanoarchaeota archaeon]|nr:hypothetical protein [Nanoarchaeota archaeon]